MFLCTQEMETRMSVLDPDSQDSIPNQDTTTLIARQLKAESLLESGNPTLHAIQVLLLTLHSQEASILSLQMN